MIINSFLYCIASRSDYFSNRKLLMTLTTVFQTGKLLVVYFLPPALPV